MIAEASPSQTVERRHFSSHLVEKSFNGGEAVLSGHIVHEFVQKFPLRTRVAFRLDVLHETLHAPFDVDEAAALLDMRATWEQIMREFSRLVPQNVANNQRIQLTQEVSADAVLCHVFSENHQVFDFAGA